MQYNYSRYYELLVGFPETYKLQDPVYPSLNVSDSNSLTFDTPLNFMAIQTSEGQGVEVTENQLVASINGNVESKGSNARNCVIKVFNLSEDTVRSLTQNNLKVILKAGYKEDYDNNNLPVIFSGQVKYSKRVNKRQENYVELTCQDGFTPSNAIKINKSLKSNPSKSVTALDVFNYLISVWNNNGIASTDSSIRFDDLPIHPSTVPFRGGWVGEGYLRDLMDELCDSFNYQWYIVNGVLYIQSAFTNRVREAIELDMSMVKGISDGEQDLKADANTPSKNRVTFTTFLNGTISEGKYINVVPTEDPKEKHTTYYGLYKIISVSHSLDFRGNTWDTKVECEKI